MFTYERTSFRARYRWLATHNSRANPTRPSLYRAPDWVCEVLSPSTAKTDRIEKMPVYAEFAVNYLWLVDPLARTLEAYTLTNELGNNQWILTNSFKDDDKVSIPPFDEIELELSALWQTSV